MPTQRFLLVLVLLVPFLSTANEPVESLLSQFNRAVQRFDVKIKEARSLPDGRILRNGKDVGPHDKAIRVLGFFSTKATPVLGRNTSITFEVNIGTDSSETFLDDVVKTVDGLVAKIGDIELVGFQSSPGLQAINSRHFNNNYELKLDIEFRPPNNQPKGLVEELMADLTKLDNKIEEIYATENTSITTPSFDKFSFLLHFEAPKEVQGETLHQPKKMMVKAYDRISFFEKLLEISYEHPEYKLVGYETSPEYYEISPFKPREIRSWGRMVEAKKLEPIKYSIKNLKGIGTCAATVGN